MVCVCGRACARGYFLSSGYKTKKFLSGFCYMYPLCILRLSLPSGQSWERQEKKRNEAHLHYGALSRMDFLPNLPTVVNLLFFVFCCKVLVVISGRDRLVQSCSILAGAKVHIFFFMYQTLYNTIKDNKKVPPPENLIAYWRIQVYSFRELGFD